MSSMSSVQLLFSADGAKDRGALISAAWSFFFNHWATSRQIDEFDRWSGGPTVPHNSIATCLARSRSGCLRAASGVVPVVEKILFDDRK
jgi:hypothetical protein